jgi:hypothetical protein
MRRIPDEDESSSALARRGLLWTAVLAGVGSGLGLLAIHQDGFAALEKALVISSGVAALVMLAMIQLFKRISQQLVATASTAYYTVYLLAGILISLSAAGNHEHVCVYFL